MKRPIIYVFLMLFLFFSDSYSQQTLKFGNVQLKDTSGSVKVNTGGLYTDFINVSSFVVPGDSGSDFFMGGQGNGLFMAMDVAIAEFYSEGINFYVPFYLKSYSSSEITELPVSEGAMIINSTTGELLIYLNGVWNSIPINPK